MAEQAEDATAVGASIEVTFPIERAVLIVKAIDRLPRYIVHEGHKPLRELLGLRDTLADQLQQIAAEKGITG